MLTVSQVMNSNPSQWGDAEEALARMSKDMNEAADGLYNRAGGKLENFWTDANGKQAHTRITELASSYSVLAMLLRAACSVLTGLDLSLGTCRNTVVDLLGQAKAYGFSVAEDGSVELSSEQMSSTNPTNAVVKAHSIEAGLKDALSDATRIDEEAAKMLGDERMTQLDFDKDGDVDADDIKGHRDDGQTLDMSSQAALKEILAAMPLDGTEQEQQQWWNSLSKEEQQMYMNAAPLEVAGMKGVPDDVKSQMSGSDELGYDRLRLLQYAQDHWNDSSIDWDKKNNCTNFVSLALENAGLDPKGTFTLQDDSWGHGSWTQGPWGLNPGSYSDSWGGADAQHDLFTRSGSQEVQQGDVRPGDIAYWSQQGAGENSAGVEHHAAIVTGVLPNGDVLYTQHTGNREDQSLAARLPYNNVQEGDQDIRFVRVKQTW
ncbi:hypothetical protein HMPREF1531_01702 [Propionibacterium sp. oral taxon 192 str. F0372]|uniref:amidase domain-containing protein n=1 Tax=Propionibacterium sp. oral taxon 192 TaxID=671222 RepID=UPI00035352E8|nr:amidase domain-containing protein [Propionibacterium sp. oral taxon 192]EPH02396.1 hypothetical protein HMPREF1531_01702 [Propionibacterium sp. oral taxon 192 str. F0372]